MDRFVGKFAVVTGASEGIGEKISEELLKRGINVVGIARNSSKLRNLSEKFSSQQTIFQGKFYARECDIRDADQIKETFLKIKSSFKSISILVNNAAIIEPFTETLTDMQTKNYDEIFNTNVRGMALCSREAIKLMTDDSSGGHIVNVSSVLARSDSMSVCCPLYTTSKKAMLAISETLRREMCKEKRKIKVSVLSPGLVDTNLPIKSGFEFVRDEYKILSPEDVAKSCIAVLDTPQNVAVLEYAVMPLFGSN